MHRKRSRSIGAYKGRVKPSRDPFRRCSRAHSSDVYMSRRVCLIQLLCMIDLLLVLLKSSQRPCTQPGSNMLRERTLASLSLIISNMLGSHPVGHDGGIIIVSQKRFLIRLLIACTVPSMPYIPLMTRCFQPRCPYLVISRVTARSNHSLSSNRQL